MANSFIPILIRIQNVIYLKPVSILASLKEKRLSLITAKDILKGKGKTFKQGLSQILLPPQVAEALVLALISAVVHNPLPWSYHDNAFCCRGPSGFGEHQSCSLANEIAGSENLRPGLSSLFGNRREKHTKIQDIILPPWSSLVLSWRNNYVSHIWRTSNR